MPTPSASLPSKPLSTEHDPVLEQQRRRLEAYAADPTQIRQDARGERREKRDYAERPLLELLQNAEDALSDADLDGDVLLDVSGDRLLVANHGTPFSARGFQALCSLNDSPKQGDRCRRFIGSKGTGFKAVLNWTDEPEIYSRAVRARFNRSKAAILIRDTIGEVGRKRLEEDGRPWPDDDMPLLQVPLPADPDAEILELQAAGWATIIRLHILPDQQQQVRHALQDLQPQQLLFLNRISRVVLAIDGARSDWQFDRKRRAQQPEIACEELTIQHNRRPIMTWHLLRRTLPETVLPRRSNDTGRSEIGRAEIGLAIQTDGLIDESFPASVCNFFPTLLRSPMSALAVHGTFLLKGDRNHLASDDLDYQMQLIEALCALLKDQLIGWLVDRYGSGALQYLRTDPGQTASENQVEAELAKRLTNAVRSHKFVPILGNRTAAPEALDLWSHGLGRLLLASAQVPEDSRLPQPDWCDEETTEILKGLGASPLALSDQLKYLVGWVPTSDADACQALELARDALQESEKRIEFTWGQERQRLQSDHKSLESTVEALAAWKTQEGGYRPLRGNPPFFDVAPSHFGLTDIVPADWLCKAFYKLLDEQRLWRAAQLSQVRGKHIHAVSADSVIEHALLPAVEKQTVEWWQQYAFAIYDILLSIKSLGDGIDDDIFASGLRLRLAKTIRVPVRGGSWQPAIAVYAGSDHGSPASEAIAQQEPDQPFLLDSTGEHPGLQGKENLLRYLGVSWSPKWRRHLEDSPRYYRHSIDELAEPPASLAGVEEWQPWFKFVLYGEVKEDGKRFPRVNIGQWAIMEAWAVEGLIPFCRVQSKASDRLRILHDIWRRDTNRRIVKIARQGPNGGSLKQDAREFSSTDESGFLYWQLSRARIFDVERSPLWPEPTAALSDLLLSSGKTDSWERWLPRLVLGHDQGDVEGAALYDFAHRLGARRRVEEFPAEQWRRWLDSLAGDEAQQQDQYRGQDLSGFLHKLAGADQDADLSAWASQVRLPCLKSGGHVSFSRLDDLLVIDDARYLALKERLLEGGQAVLLASPKDGKRLLDRFKWPDQALSKRLLATVEPAAELPGGMGFAALDQWRGLILALVAHRADRKEKAASRLRDDWPARVLVQTPLSVRLVLDQRDLGLHRQDFHWDDSSALYIDSGRDDSPSRCRENLAAALHSRCRDSGEFVEALALLLEKAAQSMDCAYDLLIRQGLSQHDIDDWQPSNPESKAPEAAADTLDVPTDPFAIRPEAQPTLTPVPTRSEGTERSDILPPPAALKHDRVTSVTARAGGG